MTITTNSFKLFSLLGILALSACATDPTIGSKSNADADINVPVVNSVTVSNKISEGYVYQSAQKKPESVIELSTDANNSYANLRRTIFHNTLPTATRLSDWLNYFNYDYPVSQGKSPLRITTEIAPAPWNKSSHLLLIGVSASDLEKVRPARNIVIVTNFSESVNKATLSLTKETLNTLVNSLRDEDKIAIVNYASSPDVLLESTSGEEKATITKKMNAISFTNETKPSNTLASLNLAYQVLEQNRIANGNNLVIFISDGETNVSGLDNVVLQKSKNGLTLSTFVFNNKNYNYQMMQNLSDLGGGMHAYIDSKNEAKRIVHQQLTSGNDLIAYPIEMTVRFNPQYVATYRLLGYEKSNSKTILRNKPFEMKAGQEFTALYEIQMTGYQAPTPEGNRYHNVGDISLEYRLPSLSYNQTIDTSLVQKQVKSNISQASKDFTFAASMAAFALQIKKDSSVNNYSIDDTIALAQDGIDKDPLELKAEFVRLLQSYKLLKESN